MRRKLDFSNTTDENSLETATATKKRAGSALPLVGRLTNGTQLQPLKKPLSSDNSREESALNGDTTENGEDSFQMVNGGSEDDFQMVEAEDDTEPEGQDAEPEENDESEIQPVPVKKGKRKSTMLDEPVEPAKKGRRGQPKKADPAPIQEEEEQPEEPQEEQQAERPTKRTRSSLDKAPEAPKNKGGRPKRTAEAAEPATKEPTKKATGKSRQSGEASNASKAKSKAQKPALATISEDSPAVKRGPPLPRNNRGLVTAPRNSSRRHRFQADSLWPKLHQATCVLEKRENRVL